MSHVIECATIIEITIKVGLKIETINLLYKWPPIVISPYIKKGPHQKVGP